MSTPTPDQMRAAAAMQHIESTYAALDRWRARSRGPEEPQVGSELHGDAVVWPGYPPHVVARLSLISGVQHLNLARAALEQREPFPIAHPTVLRGALLGAARGVWLLAPESRHERQQNALRSIHEVHRRLHQYMEADVSAGGASGQHAQALAEMVGRLHAIKALWATTPSMSAKHEPRETEIIASAARTTFADPRQQSAASLLWMQLSGDAHGLGWPMFTRSSTQQVPVGRVAGYPGRVTEFRSGADLVEIGDAFTAAFMMLRHGWSLFDRRCEAP